MQGTRRVRIVAAVAAIIAAIAAAVVVAASAVLVAAGLHDRVDQADVIVVPGSKVEADGAPSARLRARLDVALDLYRAHRAPLIVVSGGTGREGFDESIVMSRYLARQGVPASAIVEDGSGVDTSATAANTRRLMTARGLTTAIVATQYFHVPRTSLLLERQGVTVVGHVHARYVEPRDAYSIVREVFAYAARYAGLTT